MSARLLSARLGRFGLAVAGLSAGLSTILGTAPAAAAPIATPPASTTSAATTHALAANRSETPSLPAIHPDQDYAGASLRFRQAGISPAVASQLRPAIASSWRSRPRGLDVSSWQPSVNWSWVARNGGRFAYIKATEATFYRNPYFSRQYNGSRRAGLIRGAYHFALPNRSSGTAQGHFFVTHGGGWKRDGKTLPPALDIEYNPYGRICYGLSRARMVSWIKAFRNEVHRHTGRWPTIYTTTDWWRTCTGNYRGFAKTSPLWIASYGTSSPGRLPAGWRSATFWQYQSFGKFPGDQNAYNGSVARLRSLARNR